MRNYLMALLVIVALLCNPLGNSAYAAQQTQNAKGNSEQFNAEFAYKIAKITSRLMSAQFKDAEEFKAEFAYATAQVTSLAMPVFASGQRSEFAYRMAQFTTRIIDQPNLNIEKAKAEFAYEAAKITNSIMGGGNYTGGDDARNTYTGGHDTSNAYSGGRDTSNAYSGGHDTSNTYSGGMGARSEGGAARDKAAGEQPKGGNDTYSGLINELMSVGDREKQQEKKINIGGNIRYHYAFNRGPGVLGKDSSGIRARVGFDTQLSKNWQAYAMLEGQKSFVNYNDSLELARLSLTGKLGASQVTLGSFGYLMAEGNIYDSEFKGIRLDFGDELQSTLAYGQTDYAKQVLVATTKYKDFDYDIEAGLYNYYMRDGVHNKNTIHTLGGNYYFNDFSLGAMYLGSSVKDAHGNDSGYVFSFKYGELKTWRPGTYDVVAKYYNQPVGTYIAHGMNGAAGRMQGFKGYGLGTHYTLAENLVGGIEYYDLKDKVTSDRGQTWWGDLTYYF